MRYDTLMEIDDKNIDIGPITSPQTLASFLSSKYGNSRSELFIVATLNIANRIIKLHITSIGTVTLVPVTPSNIFYAAIIDNAVSILISHLHPSSEPKPSHEDISLSQRLVEAGELLHIPILDHIIFTPNPQKYFSFKEAELI